MSITRNMKICTLLEQARYSIEHAEGPQQPKLQAQDMKTDSKARMSSMDRGKSANAMAINGMEVVV